MQRGTTGQPWSRDPVSNSSPSMEDHAAQTIGASQLWGSHFYRRLRKACEVKWPSALASVLFLLLRESALDKSDIESARYEYDLDTAQLTAVQNLDIPKVREIESSRKSPGSLHVGFDFN